MVKRMRWLPVAVLVLLVSAACTGTGEEEGSYPESGRSVEVIVPFSPGGLTDLSARLLAPALEEGLGVPVEIVNQPGASSQIGVTALSQADPDGYTLGYTLLPTTPSSYLDESRGATYTRESFAPVAQHFLVPIVVAVQADSRFESLTQFLDEAAANPKSIKVGTGALGGPADMGRVMTEMDQGIEFANVQFDGGGPTIVALLGGHIDATFSSVAEVLQYVKSGELRLLGVMTAEQTDLLDGVPTFAEQGFELEMSSVGIISAPAGTPSEVLDTLRSVMESALADEEMIAKSHELGLLPAYADADAVDGQWEASEDRVKQALESADSQ